MNPQYFSADLRDLFRFLGKRGVRYLIIGGEAVIYHGYARLTGDIDIFYSSDDENAFAVYQALADFWGGPPPAVSGMTELTRPGLILQYGRPPNRIDLVNQIDGVTFEEAWPYRIEETITVDGDTVIVNYIGLNALIKNKEASGRDKDRDDLRFLKAKLN